MLVLSSTRDVLQNRLNRRRGISVRDYNLDFNPGSISEITEASVVHLPTAGMPDIGNHDLVASALEEHFFDLIQAMRTQYCFDLFHRKPPSEESRSSITTTTLLALGD